MTWSEQIDALRRELTDCRARLSAAEQERDQWEQRTESANRRMDEASTEAMQARLRAAATEAERDQERMFKFGYRDATNLLHAKLDAAEARVEAAERVPDILRRADSWLVSEDGATIHLLPDDAAALDAALATEAQ